MRDDGGPAFPKTVSGNVPRQDGMSLRDAFAMHALPICWALEQERPTGPYSEKMEPTYSGAATQAYYMADAMLAARKK